MAMVSVVLQLPTGESGA